MVDNNSSDGSGPFLKDRFATVTFIWNKKNYGFAKANNAALPFATGEYILFLNPDTIVPEDCFLKCMSFLKSHPCAGALGIHMIDGSGKFLKESKRAFPSPATSLFKILGLTSVFPRSAIFAKYYLGNLDENSNHEVDVLAGAFMMLPKKVIDVTGGFDESFFMYAEDVDLSFRIQKAGYSNFYLAESTIIHFKGESTQKGSLNYVKAFYTAMSIFVKKHYGGSKAGIFNFLIQAAILLKAIFSATARFIRYIGIPVADAVVILLSFCGVKLLWQMYIKQEVVYSSNLLIIAFPAFTAIFLASSYFSGLYDNGYKQSRLNHSAVASILVLLAGYSLLPESLRFSRGIVVFGSVIAFGMMTVMRQIFVKMKILSPADEEEDRQVIIVGTLREYTAVQTLLQHAGIQKRILGRIEAAGGEGTDEIINSEQLVKLLNTYPTKEVILCEGKLSFKELIELARIIPRHCKIKFHASSSRSIAGSDSKDVSGKIIARHSNFKLANPAMRRSKELADILISLILLVSFPVHLLLQKRPATFFKNILAVLLLRKTWVGYAASSPDLPDLKPGILSVTGVPAFMNVLPEENLASADTWYAAHYSIWHDAQMVYKNYKFLSA